MEDANGLDFMRARHYDSTLGRFTAIDPIGLKGKDTNLYRYTGNNPANSIDPQGTIWWIPAAAAAGAAIGAGLSVATYGITQAITWNKPTLGGVTGALVSGATYGAVVGGTGGLAVFSPGIAAAGMAGVGAVTSSLGYGIQSGIDGNFTNQGLLESTVIGGITGPIPWFMPGIKNNYFQGRPNKYILPVLFAENVRGNSIWEALRITNEAGLGFVK